MKALAFPLSWKLFCCGAAVITSNTSSCAEIASDAALTVDPKDTKDIAQAHGRPVNR